MFVPTCLAVTILETNRDIKAINGKHLNMTVVKWTLNPQTCFRSCSLTIRTDVSKLASQFFLRNKKCVCYVSLLDSLIDFSHSEKSFHAVWLYSS